jgi:hypothetical protein
MISSISSDSKQIKKEKKLLTKDSLVKSHIIISPRTYSKLNEDPESAQDHSSMDIDSFHPPEIQCSNFNDQESLTEFPRKLDFALLRQDSDMSEEKAEKNYKKFDFFYRRTAFRSMTEHFKGLFKPILDKWREGERKSTKNFVQQFICKNANLLGWKQPKKSQDYLKLQELVN